MDIDGLGAETIQLLFKNNLINSYADLYALTEADLILLDRLAEKSAHNIVQAIGASVNIPFHRVLFGLGIRYVGQTVAKKLAQNFGSIDALMQADVEALEDVDEIGSRIAQSVVAFFQDVDNLFVISQLRASGVQLEAAISTQPTSNTLAAMRFVVSGVFSQYSRDELKAIIEQYGGKISSSISKNTTYLVAGDKMGPAKKTKAESLGVRIISEQEFYALIKL
jgi:DNA ligase (NAD+)